MLPVHSQGRAGHRRSSFQSTGAFTALGALPRRTSKKPTFHFEEDDGSSSHDLSPTGSAVPFPRTSPLHSPSLTRTPTVLKPLKSSLKSSNSSPNIPFPPQSLVPSIMFPDLHPKHQQHQRASSAPCSPLFVSSSPPSSSSSSISSSSCHPHAPKNVHFPSQEEGGLATIRIFNRSARPASLSRLGEETETETDGEASSAGNGGWSGKYVGGSTFPFPRVTANAEKKSPLNPSKQKGIRYDIDWSASSVIPRKNIDRGNENVFFESLQVVDSDEETALQGTLLVRNITYQKIVVVRYSMDEWETVNDVSGWYDGNGEGWDRFKFSISLGGQGLEKRVVWLVGKYAGGAGESGDAVEWWDNNEGKNYRVGFKEVVDQEERVEVYKRGVVVSAPTTYTPSSTLTRPKLSDPQISSSTFASPYQQEREKERDRERAQHQAAITQSTLARLKKLNLKNYAAPRGYGYGQSLSATKETASLSSPPVLTLTSASPTTSSFVRPSGSLSGLPSAPNLVLNTTLEMCSPTLSTATSTDSTPVQTPTHGDEDDEGWKVGGEEEDRLRWSLGMENGHFATMLIPSPISSPTTTPLGSPIPVSIPKDRNTLSYTSYSKSGGVEMGTSPPFSDLKETVVGRGVCGGVGSVYWDWGTVAGVALGGGEGMKESAYESTNGGGLMPPQRRRGLQQRRGSGTSSSSESDSNSKLYMSSPSTSTSPPTPPSTATSVTPKQKLKPPKLDLPTPTFTSPTPTSVTSPSGVQSPNPRRGLGSQPLRHGHRSYQSMPSFIPSSKSPSTPGDSDAIYQALVREWCFAQGPSSNSTSGETTPVIVKSPSPLGLVCALGDGE